MDIQKLFIAHSVVLNILNVPLLITSFVFPLFSIALVGYGVIIVAASIWNHRPCQQVVRVLAYVTLVCLFIAVIFLPSLISGYDRCANIKIHLSTQNSRISTYKIGGGWFQDENRIFYGMFSGALIVFYIMVFYCQLKIVDKVIGENDASPPVYETKA